MTLPRITVITPCHNHARFIERTICSVLDQGYPNVEYIVVDGGSTDGSVETIRLYEDEIIFCRYGHSTGPGDAINEGLSHATGDIVAVLPVTDIYLHGALNEVAAVMQPHQAPPWVVGRCFGICERDKVIGSYDASAPRSLAAFLMHDSGHLPISASFLKRDCIEQAGAFATHLPFAFDYEYACRLLASGFTPAISDCALSGLREYEEGTGGGGAIDTLRRGLELLDAAAQYATYLPLKERYELWSNLDKRRRIYTLAEAEIAGKHAKRLLLGELLRHPWWLTDDAIRHALAHGVDHPVPPEMLRPAA